MYPFKLTVNELNMLLIGIAILCLGILFLCLYKQIRFYKKVKGELTRNEILADISNEYIYEYDFKKDTMWLAGELARYLNCMSKTEKWSGQIQNVSWVSEHDRSGLKELITNYKNGVLTQDFQLVNTAGIPEWYRINKIILYRKGVPCRTIGKITNVQMEYEERENLLVRANTDSLTKLENACIAKDKVKKLLKGDKPIEGALVMLDIDRFKEINDSCGHRKGDEILLLLAEIMRMTFRSEDILGRVGGDEFMIFMNGISDQQIVLERCETLNARFKERVLECQCSKIPSLSIGICMIEEDIIFEDIYDKADQALYEAKNAGRDCCLVYSVKS